uniref:LRRCT domain-containing protein n=1 Tax=Panagrolaimus sp. ES5 TaxID=591445 RepID=A0AC34F0G9_9BILA
MSNITVLRKNKILPDNEDTVEELYFNSASVQYIEAGAFDKFIALKKLVLMNNQLTYIDEKVLTPQLGSTLSSLILSGNNFTALNPMVFKNMIKLESFFIQSNPNLKEFTDIFPEMMLQVIDLSFCGIKFLQENVFKNLNIDDCAFCGLPNLEWISLYSCHQLSFIHENAFGSISSGIAQSVERFEINECNITVLPENLLDWKNVKEINIGGNPFACNCSMAWLFNDLHLEAGSILDKKIKRRYRGHKYILGCFPPLDTTHKHFLKPLNISELLEPCKQINSASSNLFWLLFFAFGFILGAIFYVLYNHRDTFEVFIDRPLNLDFFARNH